MEYPKIPDNQFEMIRRYAQEYNLDPALMASMAQIESNFNPRAVSDHGAHGVAQILNSNFRGLGITDPYDPDQSYRGMARYMANLRDQYGVTTPEGYIAGYNAGPKALKWKNLPTETQNYIAAHKQNYPFYQQLFTPPMQEGAKKAQQATQGFGTDQEVLIPQIIQLADGSHKKVSPEEAFQHYQKTGQHLGKFASPEAADRYGQLLHLQQEADRTKARPDGAQYPQQFVAGGERTPGMRETGNIDIYDRAKVAVPMGEGRTGSVYSTSFQERGPHDVGNQLAFNAQNLAPAKGEAPEYRDLLGGMLAQGGMRPISQQLPQTLPPQPNVPPTMPPDSGFAPPPKSDRPMQPGMGGAGSVNLGNITLVPKGSAQQQQSPPPQGGPQMMSALAQGAGGVEGGDRQGPRGSGFFEGTPQAMQQLQKSGKAFTQLPWYDQLAGLGYLANPTQALGEALGGPMLDTLLGVATAGATGQTDSQTLQTIPGEATQFRKDMMAPFTSPGVRSVQDAVGAALTPAMETFDAAGKLATDASQAVLNDPRGQQLRRMIDPLGSALLSNEDVSAGLGTLVANFIPEMLGAAWGGMRGFGKKPPTAPAATAATAPSAPPVSTSLVGPERQLPYIATTEAPPPQLALPAPAPDAPIPASTPKALPAPGAGTPDAQAPTLAPEWGNLRGGRSKAPEGTPPQGPTSAARPRELTPQEMAEAAIARTKKGKNRATWGLSAAENVNKALIELFPFLRQNVERVDPRTGERVVIPTESIPPEVTRAILDRIDLSPVNAPENRSGVFPPGSRVRIGKTERTLGKESDTVGPVSGEEIGRGAGEEIPPPVAPEMPVTTKAPEVPTQGAPAPEALVPTAPVAPEAPVPVPEAPGVESTEVLRVGEKGAPEVVPPKAPEMDMEPIATVSEATGVRPVEAPKPVPETAPIPKPAPVPETAAPEVGPVPDAPVVEPDALRGANELEAARVAEEAFDDPDTPATSFNRIMAPTEESLGKTFSSIADGVVRRVENAVDAFLTPRQKVGSRLVPFDEVWKHVEKNLQPEDRITKDQFKHEMEQRYTDAFELDPDTGEVMFNMARTKKGEEFTPGPHNNRERAETTVDMRGKDYTPEQRERNIQRKAEEMSERGGYGRGMNVDDVEPVEGVRATGKETFEFDDVNQATEHAFKDSTKPGIYISRKISGAAAKAAQIAAYGLRLFHFDGSDVKIIFTSGDEYGHHGAKGSAPHGLSEVFEKAGEVYTGDPQHLGSSTKLVTTKSDGRHYFISVQDPTKMTLGAVNTIFHEVAHVFVHEVLDRGKFLTSKEHSAIKAEYENWKQRFGKKPKRALEETVPPDLIPRGVNDLSLGKNSKYFASFQEYAARRISDMLLRPESKALTLASKSFKKIADVVRQVYAKARGLGYDGSLQNFVEGWSESFYKERKRGEGFSIMDDSVAAEVGAKSLYEPQPSNALKIETNFARSAGDDDFIFHKEKPGSGEDFTFEVEKPKGKFYGTSAKGAFDYFEQSRKERAAAQKEHEKGRLGRFKEAIVDQFDNIANFAAELGKYGAAGKRLGEQVSLTRGASAAALFQTKDAYGKVFKGIGEKRIEQLEEFIHLKHLEDLYARGAGGKVRELSQQQVAGALQEFQKRHGLSSSRMQDFNQRTKAFFDEMHTVLEQSRDAGLITDEVYNKLKDMNYMRRQDFDSFLNRVDPEYTSIKIRGKIVNVRDSGIQRLKAGTPDETLLSARVAMSEAIRRVNARTIKNRILLDLADLVEKNKGLQEMFSTKYEGGFRHPLIYFKEGQKKVLFMNNRAQSMMRWAETPGDLHFALRLGHIMQTPIKFLATGPGNPFFGVRNILLDSLHASGAAQFVTKAGKFRGVYGNIKPAAWAQMAKDQVNVAVNLGKRKQLMKAFFSHGGATSFLSDIKVNKGSLSVGGSNFGKNVGALLDGLNLGNTWSEINTRLAVMDRAVRKIAKRDGVKYVDALKSDKVLTEATAVARNYLDFSRGGTLIDVVDAGIPYTKAIVNLTASIGRSIKRDPAGAAVKFGQLLALEGVRQFFMREHDGGDFVKEMRERAPHHLDTFVIPLPGLGKDRYAMINPDPFHRTAISMMRLLYDAMDGEDPKAVQTAWEALGSAAPFLDQDVHFTKILRDFGNVVKSYGGESSKKTRPGIHEMHNEIAKVLGVSPAAVAQLTKDMMAQSTPFTYGSVALHRAMSDLPKQYVDAYEKEAMKNVSSVGTGFGMIKTLPDKRRKKMLKKQIPLRSSR